MSLYTWPALLLALTALHVGFRLRWERRARRRPGGRRPLDDLVEEATEYDVAYLKGGRDYPLLLAFRRLRNAGYLRALPAPREAGGPEVRYIADSGLDPAPLLAVEKDMLAEFQTENALELSAWQEAESLRRSRAWLEDAGLLVMAFDRFRELRRVSVGGLLMGGGFFVASLPGPVGLVSILPFLLFYVAGHAWLSHLGMTQPRLPLAHAGPPDAHLLTRRGELFAHRYEEIYGPLPDLTRNEDVRLALARINPCSV